MLQQSQHFARFEGCEVETMAISAIKATQHGMINSANGQQEVIKGTDKTGKLVTLYPGDVPSHLPETDFWQQQGFAFSSFLPPANTKIAQDNIAAQDKLYSHIRLDHLL